mmetsp:Transcript_47064/g.117403  ORF Transcript_47064/g.117403 Transcript_47064/m.117403 type:complete len:630 (-) Transcript_47064:389-2278(-)
MVSPFPPLSLPPSTKSEFCIGTEGLEFGGFDLESPRVLHRGFQSTVCLCKSKKRKPRSRTQSDYSDLHKHMETQHQQRGGEGQGQTVQSDGGSSMARDSGGRSGQGAMVGDGVRREPGRTLPGISEKAKYSTDMEEEEGDVCGMDICAVCGGRDTAPNPSRSRRHNYLHSSRHRGAASNEDISPSRQHQSHSRQAAAGVAPAGRRHRPPSGDLGNGLDALPEGEETPTSTADVESPCCVCPHSHAHHHPSAPPPLDVSPSRREVSSASSVERTAPPFPPPPDQPLPRSRSQSHSMSPVQPSCTAGEVGSDPRFPMADDYDEEMAPEQVVLKVVDKHKLGSREELIRAEREVQMLRRLHHDRILPLLKSLETDAEISMLFEYAPLGDLHKLASYGTRTVPEREVRKLCHQLLEALVYLHRQRIVHADLKPENLLLFEDADSDTLHIKLCDFGLAQQIPASGWIAHDGIRGTQGYLAPELLLGQSYNEKIDIWALGIIVYTLIAGYEPFYPSSDCLHSDVEFDERYWSSVSDECKDFLGGALSRNVSRRLSAEGAIAHGWFHCAAMDTPSGHALMPEGSGTGGTRPSQPALNPNLWLPPQGCHGHRLRFGSWVDDDTSSGDSRARKAVSSS